MSDTLVKVKNIKKSFQKDGVRLDVLKGIDLEINQGDFITIMGPSGAGKSTFLHILGKLDHPTEGQIWFRDTEITTFSPEEESRFRNEDVGFIFQFYHLLQDFDVLENIMMPLRIKGVPLHEARATAEESLEVMGLGPRKRHKPGELSGGEQQRVAIARALINKPQLILADEPTGNLDRKTGTEVLKYMLDIHEKISSAIVLVTHDPRIGSVGTRQLNMVDGEFSDLLT
jgi:ABC-type lipoprotein export system ATPase subunit